VAGGGLGTRTWSNCWAIRRYWDGHYGTGIRNRMVSRRGAEGGSFDHGSSPDGARIYPESFAPRQQRAQRELTPRSTWTGALTNQTGSLVGNSVRSGPLCAKFWFFRRIRLLRSEPRRAPRLCVKYSGAVGGDLCGRLGEASPYFFGEGRRLAAANSSAASVVRPRARRTVANW
jgi:hypothetical protein